MWQKKNKQNILLHSCFLLKKRSLYFCLNAECSSVILQTLVLAIEFPACLKHLTLMLKTYDDFYYVLFYYTSTMSQHLHSEDTQS